MDGKARRGDGWINGQTVKEGRRHKSNQRRMERSREAEGIGLARSPPPPFDAVPSSWRIHFQPDVTSCRVSFQSRPSQEGRYPDKVNKEEERERKLRRTCRRPRSRVRSALARESGRRWCTIRGWCSSALDSSAAP